MDNSISYEAAPRKGEFSQKCRSPISVPCYTKLRPNENGNLFRPNENGNLFENQKKFPFSDLRGIGTLRYFTRTRRKNEDGAPSGVTLTFIGVHIADFDALWIAHNFIIWINRSNTMSHPCDG